MRQIQALRPIVTLQAFLCHFIGRLVAQDLPGVIIHPILDPFNPLITDICYISALRDEAPDHPILILVRASLP